MAPKTAQLQIRVTPREKALIKRLARASGQDISGYVLGRVLGAPSVRVAELIEAMRDDARRRYVLAELNDVLSAMAADELHDATAALDVRALPDLDQNYVAAMVEQAAARRGIAAPSWTRHVAPLEQPWFTTTLSGLRLHLLRAAPVVFKRRNLFVDASIGDRV